MKVNLKDIYDEDDDEQFIHHTKRKMSDPSGFSKIEKIVKTKKRPDQQIYRKDNDSDKL